MELALELVNHVPQEMADRLVGRLRAAEVARMAASERAAEAAGRIDEARARARAAEEELARSPALGCSLGAGPVALLLVSLLAAGGLLIGAPGRMHASGVAATACREPLREARGETQALRRRHEELQGAYRRVLEAKSKWLEFLRNAAQASDRPLPAAGIAGAEGVGAPRPGVVEARCFAAARPGHRALEALLGDGPSGGPRGGPGDGSAAGTKGRPSRRASPPATPSASAPPAAEAAAA